MPSDTGPAPTAEANPTLAAPSSGDVTASNNPDAPVALGASGQVGEYTVTVTSVDTNADTAVARAAPHNSPPSNGRYLLVGLSATYNGTGIGSAEALSGGLRNFDGTEFRLFDCAATLPRNAADVPPLAPGESGSWQFCLDVTPGSLEGGGLFVSELFASFEARTYPGFRSW